MNLYKELAALGTLLMAALLVFLVVDVRKTAAVTAYDRGLNSVYSLRPSAPGGAYGSAVVIKTLKGLRLISNAHVCITGDMSFFVFSAVSPTEKPHFMATVERIDPTKDLCVLKIVGLEKSPVAPEPLTLAGNPATSGSFVAAIGYGYLSQGPVMRVSTGLALSVGDIEMPYPPYMCDRLDIRLFLMSNQRVGCTRHIQGITHTAGIIGGESGGALLNKEGELVGIVFGREQETGFSVSLKSLKEFLKATF